MGKSDFLIPKTITNRIKSKELQKLRWHCQMCQKQCRDENGFKYHCMSEFHQKQLLLASENPQQFMDYFSEEFHNDFLEFLRRRFGTKRVHNNIVYNEYISHWKHIHMNATQWETLTDFAKWLDREGLCKVNETPKGWHIQYIDRDPETFACSRQLEQEKKQDLEDEEKNCVEGKDKEALVFTKLSRENDEDKVTYNLNQEAYSSAGTLGSTAPSSAQPKGKKKKSALEEIMETEEKKKRTSRTAFGCKKYHKEKGVIKELTDKHTAIIKMTDSGDKLKFDQTHLETVIPAPGERILVLNGGYRGNEVIDTGPLKECRLEGIQYDDISKLA
uniref:DNA/RNA-binding protein Kin17 WH-like domain-containing protein n=1 Tax=Chinchilla lanigera TaxID=34839 RepID=A0A8C2V5C0_CHILA